GNGSGAGNGRGDGMGWEILWPLLLGFALSGVIQALVSRERIAALVSDDSPRSLGAATGLGAASS
ncbi:hypothetical protein QK292_19065, partial [Arthrobacter sp. AL08]|uniref:hypothetical protein n=2 Tax=Micrococcaceae TaxID=1268 RepID=UPI002499E5A1